MNFPIFPPAASTSATQTDYLFLFLLGLSFVILVLVFLPLTYFLFKYRRGHAADRTPLNFSTTKIELAWTIVPVFIVTGVFGWGAEVFFQEEVPPPGTLEINVIGKQWMWKVQHQEGNREINELHVPLNRAVRLTLASEDVIHSFYVPAFRLKQDVVPGRFTTEWFQPTRTGAYHFYCSEYCGADHSRMAGTVYVLSAAEYQAWLAHGSPHSTLAQAGENRFRELGCSGCHTGASAIHAPPLEGLYGKFVPLSDGQFVRADDQYIRDSILLPASQVVAGYQPLMPTYAGHINDEALLELIAYIKGLAGEAPLKNP